ncbi:hypothetical protein BU14_0032s0056 [Porphyra umbilicalis]|uniref:Spondin domain-containing protein n=1 Tax=Porphyra umbilicalis TaxID=2786 RepID=A0A1X6PJD1_PORUM|nr:hypothetical protein BU14_0032s0056 [Porphyra umbilicalis]|eukprot:OSX80798.1 hypothetical protein BU14_0032s0056 [Porphyra umbilicalis]
MMNKVVTVAVAAAVAVALAATGADAGSYRPRTCSGTREYEVTFYLNWSRKTHPQSYPSNGNFSPATAAAHAPRYQMWAPGAFASAAIKAVAETGDAAPLRAELAAYQAAGHVASWAGAHEPTEDGTETVTLTVTADASTGATTVSGATMLFPSPDWFTGFHAVPVCKWGRWVTQACGRLTFWDAGTDGGETHAAADAATAPPTTIFSIQNRDAPAFNTPYGKCRIKKARYPKRCPIRIPPWSA